MSRIGFFLLTFEDRLVAAMARLIWHSDRRLGMFALPIHLLVGAVIGLVLGLLLDILVMIDGAPKSPASILTRVQGALQGLVQSEANAILAEAYDLMEEWDWCEDGKRQAAVDVRIEAIRARLEEVTGKKVAFTSYGLMHPD